MKILLAIDGSDFSNDAINELTKMPLPPSTEICIMNVYEFPSMGTQELLSVKDTIYTYNQEFIANAKKSAEKIVSNASKVLKTKNEKLKLTTSVVGGLPKIAILEKAESYGADLIVVGSQGHGAFSRFLLGSVSQSIATHAKCSVMIARKKDEK